MVFLWFSYGFPWITTPQKPLFFSIKPPFSYGFPMVFLWFSMDYHASKAPFFLPAKPPRADFTDDEVSPSEESWPRSTLVALCFGLSGVGQVPEGEMWKNKGENGAEVYFNGI